MDIVLKILGFLFAYAFIGGISYARREPQAIKERGCTHKNHYTGGWCSHTMASFWWYGVFWLPMLPVALGAKVGSSTSETRTQKRHARELDEARHQAELAKQKRIADAELDQQLAALTRKGRD